VLFLFYLSIKQTPTSKRRAQLVKPLPCVTVDGGGSAVVAWRALAALDDSFTLAMGRQTVTCYAAATNKREQMLPLLSLYSYPRI
jgi:hypothetical protein